MKTNKIYWIICALLSFSFLSSCGDDDDSKYSNVSSNDAKKLLQEDAISFVSEFEGLQDEKAYKTLNVFGELLDIHSPSIIRKDLDVAEALITINDFDGKYDWSQTRKQWVYSAQSNKLSFHFPSTVTGSNNTEEIVITGEPSENTVLVPSEQTGKRDVSLTLPKRLDASIKSGDTEVGTVHVSSSYPDWATIFFNYGAYTIEANPTTDKISTSVTLKKGNLVLLAVNADADGNLDIEEEVADITKGNFSASIMDKLRFEGNINNIMSLEQEMEDLDDSYYQNSDLDLYEKGGKLLSKKWATEASQLLNNNVSIALKSAEGTLIADLVFEPKMTWSGQQHGYYNYHQTLGWEWIPSHPWTSEYWEETPKLRFADGTTHDFDVYFGNGFEDLIKKIESLAKRFDR